MRLLPLFVEGPYCPRCGSRTERVRTRFYLRPVRWLLADVRRRSCLNADCAWRGFAFPVKVNTAEPAHPAAVR